MGLSRFCFILDFLVMLEIEPKALLVLKEVLCYRATELQSQPSFSGCWTMKWPLCFNCPVKLTKQLFLC